MFGSEILEVAIGLTLVYLLLSLICSAIREGLEGWRKTRAAYLQRGIRELLQERGGGELTRAIYSHPQVSGLYRGDYDPSRIKEGFLPSGANLPSYVPSRNFVLALIDIVARGKDAGDETAAGPTAPFIDAAGLRASVGTLGNARVQRVLLSAIDTAGGDLQRVQANLEAWYDSSMDRVSGWYKRRTQVILFVLGLAVTIAANANTINIATFLYSNDSARQALVAEAEVVSRDPASRPADVRARFADLDRLGLPIGWTANAHAPWSRGAAFTPWDDVIGPIIGWLVTAFAVSLGASFWFDLLNKFMVVRATVKPHEKSPEESSEDRQRPEPARRGLIDDGGRALQVEPQGAVATAGVPFLPNEWADGDEQEGVL